MFKTVVDENGVQTNIDTVVFDPLTVQGLTDQINPNQSEDRRTVSINMVKDTTAGQETDEQAVEIPAVSVDAMAQKNAILSIDSPFASIKLNEDTVKELSELGTDLYFRIVPIKDDTKKNELASSIH